MGVNSLPKTVTQQHHDCDLNPGPSVPESSTLTTRLLSHHKYGLVAIFWCRVQSISPAIRHPYDRHTHPFNGPFSGTTQLSRYQKGKTNLDFTGARDSEWQWHQLGCMQVCTLLQTDNHASTPPLSFFTGRMPFLPPNQQRQSTEGWQLLVNANKTKQSTTNRSSWAVSLGLGV